MGLSQRLEEIEDEEEKIRQRLGVLKSQPPSEDVKAAIEAKEAELEANKKVEAEVRREADALNDAVRQRPCIKGMRAAWVIVKRNMEAEIKALERQARGALAEQPPDTKAAERLQKEAEQMRAEVKLIDESLK